MSCSMIPETSLLTWPPLGEISVSDQSIETDLSTFVAVFNLVFVFFNQHGIFFLFQGRPHNAAAGGPGPAHFSQGIAAFKLYLLASGVNDSANLIYECVFHGQEERWFSGELKKELDKVQGHLKQVNASR